MEPMHSRSVSKAAAAVAGAWLVSATLLLTQGAGPETLAESGPPRFEAVLAGHAALPARTLIAAPADAPAALQTSGKFIGGGARRSDAEPTDGARPPFAGQPVQGFSGARPPFAGQPVQGFSGVRSIGDGRFFVLTDNGFGAMENSPDAMLAFHVVRPDWETGAVAVERTTFFSDPDRVAPFPIAMEGTEARYLTGADFDVESFQMVGEDIVVGDEFGPYVFVADAETGVLSEFHETMADGAVVKSPDHFSLRLPNPDGALPAMRARRSRGFEGLAISTDGATLYPLLEGPLWDAETGDYERVGGVEALRVLEMDAATREWTGRHWLYPLAQDGNAIGDFNMIDATRGLVIERDSRQGHPDRACREDMGRVETDGCFERPARFKRVYMIDMAGVAPGRPVRKVGYIDLMDIADPNGVARLGARADGRFAFPFVTIENVDRVDETRIVVANDNNFPFSKGRDPDEIDDSEFILLEVADFLNARAE